MSYSDGFADEKSLETMLNFLQKMENDMPSDGKLNDSTGKVIWLTSHIQILPSILTFIFFLQMNAFPKQLQF